MSYRTPALIASATEPPTVPPSTVTASQRPSRSTNSRFRISTSTVPPTTVFTPSAYRTRTVAVAHRVPTVSYTHRNSSISAQMLAPVVTKEMQLFKLGPTNKNNLRNVRARAQSLNEGISTGSIAKQQLQAARSVSAGGHRVPKSSVSVGNLPSLSGSPGSSGASSTSSSPPKSFSVRKATLDPIVEGVELGAVSSSPAIVSKKRSGSTPTTAEPASQLQTMSTLQKHATSDSLVDKEEKKKKEGGVLGWLSKTFSKKSRSEDEPGTSKDSAEAGSTSSSSSGVNGDESSPSKKTTKKKL